MSLAEAKKVADLQEEASLLGHQYAELKRKAHEKVTSEIREESKNYFTSHGFAVAGTADKQTATYKGMSFSVTFIEVDKTTPGSVATLEVVHDKASIKVQVVAEMTRYDGENIAIGASKMDKLEREIRNWKGMIAAYSFNRYHLEVRDSKKTALKVEKFNTFTALVDYLCN